jgi:aminoglycoside phosphotransferase (APT) family kinase protein
MITTRTDEPRPVRDGEQLDVVRLEPYLAAHLPESLGSLTVEQFLHGHSNLTYLVRSGDREWVLRRPPFGNRVKTAHDMGREYRILSRLCHVYPPAPRPVVYCEDENILGAPFYLMERRKGVILRGTPAPDRPIAPDLVLRLCETLVDNMALLHALDYRAAGLEDLGKPQGYVERQVNGWIKRYQDARTDDVPDLERTIIWLAANVPAELGNAALIHNDFKFDNLVLDPNDLTRLLAVLDWEMATLGQPEEDLAWFLLLDRHHSEGVGAERLAGFPGPAQTIARYEQLTGRSLAHMEYYEVLSALKFAVVMARIGQLFIYYDLVPADNDFPYNNTASQLLAKILGLPPPGGEMFVPDL